MNKVADQPLLGQVPASLSFGVFRAALLAICGVAVLFLLVSAVRYIPVVGDNSYPESAAVLSAQRYAQGLGLYGDYRRPPYMVTAFTPLWYVLLSIPARLGVKDLDTLALSGRLLVLVALFGVAALGYLWNLRIGMRARQAILTPAFYLSIPTLIPWAMTARPDFPSLLCSMLALYVAGSGSGATATAAGALIAATAFLIRHNAAAVPAAVVLWLLFSKRWKHAVVFCSVWALTVGAVLGAFQSSSGGNLLLNLSGAKFGRMTLTYGRDVILRLLVTPGHGMVIALLAFGILGFVCNLRSSNGRAGLMNFYLATSVAVAGLGSAAAGADLNHFFEPALALALLVPTALARMEETWTRSSALSLFAAITMAVVLLPSLDMQRWALMHNRPDNVRALLPYSEHRRILTDIPYLAARSSAPEALDLASLTYAANAGQWSATPLIAALDKKQYESVILGEGALTPYDQAALYPRYPHLNSEVQTAILRNYSLCFKLNGVYVYGPHGATCR